MSYIEEIKFEYSKIDVKLMNKSHFVAKNMFHKMNSNFERTESVYTQTDSNFWFNEMNVRSWTFLTNIPMISNLFSNGSDQN